MGNISPTLLNQIQEMTVNEQLLSSYPSLSLDAIEEAIAFAKSLDNDHYLRKLFEGYYANLT